MSASQSQSGSDSESSARAAIEVEVNGEAQTLTCPATVATLIERLEMSGRRVAVAVNRNVVVRGAYAETNLGEGDRVEILEAVGGG